MVSITIRDILAIKAIELVCELKLAGLIVNQDFEWAFYHEQVNNDRKDRIQGRYCEFRFRDPKLATFYSLKWNTLMN